MLFLPGNPAIRMPDLPFKSAAVTHVGKVRETNQDSYVQRDDAGLWAVADGMGGHAAGDLASAAVARCLEDIPRDLDLDQALAAVRAALAETNTELIAMARGRIDRAPGSTVAVLLIRANEGVVAWAGDSRVYRLRNGRAEQLTRDHSHVQQLVDQNVIGAKEAESHPMAHMITRAVGSDETLRLETARIDVSPGDRYLLCSDGLSRVASPGEIEVRMRDSAPQAIVDALLQVALDAGAPDNVTVLAVECSQSSRRAGS